MTYKLGILDQSPISPGKTAGDALRRTVELVQKAEEWGYERFWVSEHHQTLDLAGTSPEVLVSHLLAKTTSIKVGSGGVMLQHYSPFKVVEDFQLLSLLSPGRVELGIGKAPGGFSLATQALRYGGAGSDVKFDERFRTLHHFIHDTLPEDHELYGAEALPKPDEKVPVFLLGASANSAKLAAEQGANFVYAHFLNSNNDFLKEAIQQYRKIYPEGKFIVAVASFAAETQTAAEQAASDYKIYKIFTESGRSMSVRTLDQVEAFREQTDEIITEIKEQEVEMIAGSPDFVKNEFDKLASAFGVEEFIIHTPILDEEKRLKSYELLSQLAVPVLGK